MAKEGKQQLQASGTLRKETSAQVTSKIDYPRPLSSPYALPIITLYIGNQRYSVPEHFARQIPQLQQQKFLCSTTLHDVHEDAGHTLLHFLYTGKYETIGSPLDENDSDIMKEYRKSLLVYQASRTYGLFSLEALARDYVESFGEELSVPDILRITGEVFSKLPEDEVWLLSYIKESLRRPLEASGSGLILDEIYKVLGHDHNFDNTVTKMMVEILSVRLRSSGNTLEDDEPATEEFMEQPFVKDCGAEELVEKHSVEEPATEEPATKEPAIEEPATEEPATKEPAEWTIPDAPSGVEDWPDASLDLEGVPADENLFDIDGAPAEISSEAQPDRNDLTRVPIADLALYENWENLSPKRKAQRKRKLKKRGLPIPGDDNFISILVA